ncbi:MAG: T9SS type A sorting domain-containing protein [Elusimicrobiota bacterium]|nr:MAG: T9SS type A sorting domain-containing protein [Elusimicrobiota bacterium]
MALSTLAYEAGASKLTDGKIRLYYTQPLAAGSSATVIASALSTDALGTAFAQETGFRVSTTAPTGALAFPVPARSTDSFRWRLYYAAYESFKSTGDVRSALTGSPAPVSLSPNTIYASAGSIPLTIKGEVFSAGPTVSISRGAVVIPGTSVTRADDQTITASFATQGQSTGSWDVTVTNADGVPATAVGALTIDFAPGAVVLMNNLLRPSAGVPTTVDITTFNSGLVTARVYDLNGRPMNTLFEGNVPAGAFTVTWNGRTAAGASAPSGVYFVHVTGPKLNTKAKIVLIR